MKKNSSDEPEWKAPSGTVIARIHPHIIVVYFRPSERRTYSIIRSKLQIMLWRPEFKDWLATGELYFDRAGRFRTRYPSFIGSFHNEVLEAKKLAKDLWNLLE